MAEGGPYKVGQRFGPYTLEAYLGTGAFKSVYRARHDEADSPTPVVALGFPHQQDPEGLTELEQEFSVTSRLAHPNILRAYQMERAEGISFLVMEYLEGQSLRAMLRERGALESAAAVRYVGLICDALTYAHTARVLHRDIKPENVFITTDNVPKILDFGVARVLARTSEKASTRIGTMEYMAPELLQGAAGTNADLWALGITLYELLTGTRPFIGDIGDLVQKILTAKVDEAPLRQHGVDNRIIRVLRKLLRKNPDDRYQTADELARDLEVVARRTRLVTDDESRLEVLIRASYPLIYIYSFEEGRVTEAVQKIAARLSEDRGQQRQLYRWSASRGLRDDADQVVSPDSFGDPTAALAHVIANPEDSIYLFYDPHRHLTPVTTRLVRDAARAVRMTRKSVLFLAPSFQIPDELQKEMSLLVFSPPDRDELEPLVDRMAEEVKAVGLPVELTASDRLALARAAAGLTRKEAELALRKAATQNSGLRAGCEKLVVEEKTQIIRKTGILEYYPTSESFADVGGLEGLKAWFNLRTPVFSGAARYAGLQQPKGVLLVGVPGCGKSLSARSLAGMWGVPLLRLDVGRIFGSLVGESESNLRLALQTAEAVSPCILWIDEVEKGFAGVRSGGGVTERVFGTFLQWLQDKKSPVFVVATANDISALPPEFLRQGRFDDIFFVDLPDQKQRADILRIHLARRGRQAETFDLPTLAEASAGFSGAELEQAMLEGFFRAFEADREVETTDIAQAIQNTFPLSRTRVQEIAALQLWARQSAKSANR